MRKILLMRESRTEHAKWQRRMTGTNNFRDKCVSLLVANVMQCVGTFLTTDNLLTLCYE